MNIGDRIVQFSMQKPKVVTGLMLLATIVLGAMISMVRVDTDPENMLSEKETVRIFHDRTKKEFALHDVVVLGVVNEKHPDGVFNPHTLKRVQELTEFAQALVDPADPSRRVVKQDLLAPGNVDTIEQAGAGQVRFEWLMKTAPTSRTGALKIRDLAMGNPLLKGTLVSEDQKAIGIYIPITAKEFAYQVRQRLLEKIESFGAGGDERYYITGLPVAEDTFGVEMFVQMAVSAPLAMLAIFLLMLIFFKRLKLIISPLIIAMVTVICTMGLLIGTGNTLHIMSSMIPIFLMPIAVVDSIHIMSEIFDTHHLRKDRQDTIRYVMRQLFRPMLFTSLTSAAGFASLALTPIPPVQVFGIFVAIGIMLAWLLTVMFIPAYSMLLKEESFNKFGLTAQTAKTSQPYRAVTCHLCWVGRFTQARYKMILAVTALLVAVAAVGITKIQINDNPVKWFAPDHPIREADRVLNSHFGGTYEAYLVLEGVEQEMTVAATADWLKARIEQAPIAESGPGQAARLITDQLAGEAAEPAEFAARLAERWEEQRQTAVDDDAAYEAWSELLDILAEVNNRAQIFKQPAVLRYVAALQEHLQKSGSVGKSNSVTDVVKKVHQELFAGAEEYFRVPDSQAAVAQCLISFQNSHKPGDLWHLVTPDYRKANLWVQLKSGDNKEMEAVIRDVAQFFQDNPPPVALMHQWAGLTYLNVVWQDKMVWGMLNSFLSSFAVVFVMMAILFRSPLWGLLAMVPLSITIIVIYGLIGLVGKDYDMPVAVLSSLTLGLAVDFAIHFLERTRMAVKKSGSWRAAADDIFREPARAITRNVIVIAIGFTPLLAAPLVPYKTVGVFLAGIMVLSGFVTMFILPSFVVGLEARLFKRAPK